MSRFSDIRQAIMAQGNSSGMDLSEVDNLMQSSAANFNNAKEFSNKFSEQIDELNKNKEESNNPNKNLQIASIQSLSSSINGLNPNINNNLQMNTNTSPVNNDLASLLAKHEGGGSYDTLFGHSQREGGKFAGVRPSTMTLNQLKEFTSPNGAYGQWVKGQVGRVATPIGAGQIVGSTLNRTAQALGLSGDTVFDANTQNKMINYLAQQRINNANSLGSAIAGLRSEWAGFKNVPDAQLAAIIRPMSNGRF